MWLFSPSFTLLEQVFLHEINSSTSPFWFTWMWCRVISFLLSSFFFLISCILMWVQYMILYFNETKDWLNTCLYVSYLFWCKTFPFLYPQHIVLDFDRSDLEFEFYSENNFYRKVLVVWLLKALTFVAIWCITFSILIQLSWFLLHLILDSMIFNLNINT